MARHIHVHLERAWPSRKTRDAAEITASDYEQLAEELLAFIVSKSKTGDADPNWEESKHPRADNGQFGSGGGGAAPQGAKPTSTSQTKNAKHAVHELLSSGHPFTLPELAKAIGAESTKNLSAYISMFKNEKTAGAKGTLDIVKLPGGQYQVVKKDGQPAPKVEVPKKQEPAPVPATGFRTLPKVADTISPEEFAGGDKSDFVNGMHAAKGALLGGAAASAKKMKEAVEAAMTKRLASSKSFQDMKNKYETSFSRDETFEERLISSWAHSSGNGHPVPCAMQLAVKEAFGLKDAVDGGMTLVKEKSPEEIRKDAAEYLRMPLSTAEENQQFNEALKDFVKAQYDETQEFFAEKGIKELSLVRGMTTEFSGEPRQVNMALQPASSFSADLTTARSFAESGGATMLLAKVPVSHILSTYRTGYGCAKEHEVVVLGDSSLTAVAMKASATANLGKASETAHAALRGQAQPA